MSEVQRVPISTASRKGVSWLADSAAEHQTVLTRFGQPVAVVVDHETHAENANLIREAKAAVVEAFADLGASRAKSGFSLDDICLRLGLDAEEVRARAAARSEG